MNSTSTDRFCLPGEGLVSGRLGLLSIVTIGALQLAACGSDNAGLAPSMGTGGAGGSPSAAGGTGGDSSSSPGPSSGGASQGACKAPAAKVIAKAGAAAAHLTASGSDLYFIDTSDTFVTSIRHIKDDGTSDGNVYTSPEYESNVLDIVVSGDTIYFAERNPSGFVHLYRIPRSGGSKVQITKGEGEASGSADLGGATSDTVFLSAPTDTGHQIRRVSVNDGTETVIAEHKGLVFKDIQILGSDIWFLANEGLDGYFKVPVTATTSSAVQVGTGACPFEAAVTPMGAFCSGAVALQRMPLTGGDFADVWDLPNGVVDVSRPDGNFIYLVPKSNDNTGTLRKYPIAGGNATDVSCNRGQMTVPVFNDRAILWFEFDPQDDSKTDLYSAPK